MRRNIAEYVHHTKTPVRIGQLKQLEANMASVIEWIFTAIVLTHTI